MSGKRFSKFRFKAINVFLFSLFLCRQTELLFFFLYVFVDFVFPTLVSNAELKRKNEEEKERKKEEEKKRSEELRAKQKKEHEEHHKWMAEERQRQWYYDPNKQDLIENSSKKCIET